MTRYVALSFLLLLVQNSTCQQDPGDIMNSKLREVHLHRKSELIFLLDNSGSIGVSDFKIQLQFVESLLMQFSIGPNDTRVSVVSYNEKAERCIDFITQKPDNKCNFLSRLKDIKYLGGSATNIELALQEASNIFANSLRSGENDVNKVLILLSDGVSNTGGSPAEVAEQLQQDGVEIYAIAVGLFDRSQLRLIASSPPDDHFFIFYNFEDFQTLALRIRGDPTENQYALVDQNLCDSLCVTGRARADQGCCHEHARCSCSLVGGRHGCVCGPGYFGLNGIQACEECPRGTHKSTYAEVNACTPCPPNSTTMVGGSTSLSACECVDGYKGDPAGGVECTVKRCARLSHPRNGQVTPRICPNIYQSECSFECNLGYELIDPASARRRCQADSFWSETKAQCQKLKCGDIPTPTDGSMLCLGQADDGSNVYGTTCSFTCAAGFNPIGNRERECTGSGEWSGEPFSCKGITCPVLPSLSNGDIVPPKCGNKRQKVKLSCAFNCHDGFKLHGPMVKQCETSGNWSSDEQVACVDDIPPEITCPDTIEKEAEPGLSSAEVTWDEPTVSDNLDGTDALIVTVHPAGLKPSHRFEIGFVRVMYTVTDTAGSSAECYFKVVIKDTQPPTVENCPDDEIDITSPQKIKAVNWEEPQFADNSKEELALTQSHEPGVELTWGVHIVTYTATDAAGLKTECQFRIRIGPTECPNHPDPRNGARACDQWLFGTFCRVYCNQAFEFAEKPASWYICGQGRWATNPRGFSIPWPDCSEIHDPNGARLAMETQYYAGDCTNAKTQRAIQSVFVDDFKKSMFGKAGGCMAVNSCLMDEVTVYCGEIDEDEERRRRRRRSPGTTELHYTVTIDFTVATQIRSPDKGQHKAQLENATQTLEEIKGDFAKLAGAGQLHLVVENQTLSVIEGSFSANRTVPLCRTGSMLLDTECINCAVGSHLDTVAQECRVCEEGEYQDEEGQDHCKTCPPGTWTAGTQAKDISECRTECNPGTFSPSGLSTCKPCPIGSYQHAFKQQACIPCREGTTTSAKGSRSSRNCRAVCSQGKYSVTGLRPCKPCPLGMYQPQEYQTECLPCPHNQMTTDEGATSESECRDINACESAPCQNGGQCERDGGSFYCGCPPGFAGNTCEMEVDECAPQPCFFGATCVDRVDGFVCVCASGYEGTLCDVETNECLSNPCQNEAKCQDQIARLECDCVDGFTGIFCETPPDRCASQPCLNGAVCTQTPSTYNCQCQAGYQGARCEVDVDECYEKPCQNGASCINLPGSYQCACVPGYEGVNCEVDINECLGHSCANGATCRDVIDGYQCLCLPGTAGILCETEMSQEFHLGFHTSSTSEFSLVERDNSELRAVTLSMWIRSSDSTNMGTPFSYATKRTANGSADIVDNALTVTDCASLKIYVNGQVIYTDAAINTGYWTSLLFTWSSEVGEWSLYLNGSVAANGVSRSTEPVPGEGVFALGQEQDSLGGSFSSREAFIGDIYKINLWDKVLPENDISTISRNCFEGHGNLLAWSDFLEGLEGETLVPLPTDDGHEVPDCKLI